MTLLTQAAFKLLPAADQVAYVQVNGAKFLDAAAATPAAPAQLFAEDSAVVPAASDTDLKFDIEGDSVYLNVTVDIAGQKFRLQGVKLTEKRNCMTSWDKDAKAFTKEQADVMSVIDMVRTHGAQLVNEHATFDVRLGKAGESHVEKRDPLAAILEAKKLAAELATVV